MLFIYRNSINLCSVIWRFLSYNLKSGESFIPDRFTNLQAFKILFAVFFLNKADVRITFGGISIQFVRQITLDFQCVITV